MSEFLMSGPLLYRGEYIISVLTPIASSFYVRTYVRLLVSITRCTMCVACLVRHSVCVLTAAGSGRCTCVRAAACANQAPRANE